MGDILTIQWNGQRFNKRNVLLTIVIVTSLLLNVSLFLTVILTHHARDDIGDPEPTPNIDPGDDFNKTNGTNGQGTCDNRADPEPTPNIDPGDDFNKTNGTNGQELSEPQDCYDILMEGKNTSGVYYIYPYGEQRAVYCDQETEGGGWTVFQRRCDGSEDFYRGWDDYKRGFGHLTGEFWLGNEFLFMLTKQKNYSLRVDLENFENESRYAKYQDFAIEDVYTDYRLEVNGYTGTAGDSLTRHSAHPFATKDHDAERNNCPLTFNGAWWYSGCHSSNLNGLYHAGFFNTSYADGVSWQTWLGHSYSLKTTEMKCRPTLP